MATPLPTTPTAAKKDRKKPERVPSDPGVMALGRILRQLSMLSGPEVAFVLSALNARFGQRNGQS